VIVGFTKDQEDGRGRAAVVKSLDERLTQSADGISAAECATRHADPLEGFGTRRGGPT